jgi:hypothetical protein
MRKQRRSKPSTALIAVPSQEPTESETLTALQEQRLGIMSKIETLKTYLKDTVIQLDHIEATMRLFDPDIDFTKLGARRVLPVDAAAHGEVTRTFLAALVDAGRPLSTAALVERVIMARGMDRTDPAVRKIVSKRIRPSLRYAEEVRGLIRHLPGPGQMYMWELVP